MCVTFFCFQPENGKHSNVQFMIGFNRDEQTKRNTDPLSPFPQDKNIYAGKDKISGGTWLGVNIKTGIIVILTNYDLLVQRYGKSRGKLVLSFLKTSSFQNLPLEKYNRYIEEKLCQVLNQGQKYSAFNLLAYSIQTQTIFYICSQKGLDKPIILEKNTPYGMCNGSLDQLWQKTKHGLNKFQNIIGNLSKSQHIKEQFFEQMAKILKDNVTFDQDLQKQASIFINPYYSNNEKAERMTKCSFLGLIRYQFDQKTGQKKYLIDMKETTYTSPNLQQTSVEYTKTIGITYA